MYFTIFKEAIPYFIITKLFQKHSGQAELLYLKGFCKNNFISPDYFGVIGIYLTITMARKFLP
jgi:hypothetical protein